MVLAYHRLMLKLMDPRITMKLLEGHRDTITAAAQKQEQFYRGQSCPYCAGNAFSKERSPSALHEGEDLPRWLLRCNNCGCVFDPHTGIVLATGNLAKAYVPSVPLIDD